MDSDSLAVDNRYFFEWELARLFQTHDCAKELRQVFARPFGSGDPSMMRFKCEQGQESLLQFRNKDMRELLHRMEVCMISIKLAHGSKASPLHDSYQFAIDEERPDLVTLQIVEYRLASGTSHRSVDPLSDIRADNLPLVRIVELSVCPVVLLPRA